MGEATYYAKIKFNTVEEAQEHFEPLKAILLDICKAEEYWQKNRHYGWVKEAVEETPEKFWKGMEAFPHAMEYMKHAGLWGGDCNNGLAGQLDVLGNDEDIDYVEVHENEIWWCSTVWHFADWSPFEQFINQKWNCRMNWLSDEYTNPYDLL